MDDADRATEVSELEREHCVQRSRGESSRMPGPYLCVRCGELNDRRQQGYGACWDCTTEASNASSD